MINPGIVFVDQLFVMPSREPQAFRTGARHGHRWCHLWSSDIPALHAFAGRLGMRIGWFQNKPGFPHYDLVPPRRARAMALGAVEMELMRWARLRRRPTNERLSDFIRASGLTTCDVCCRLLFDHPTFIDPETAQRWDWLRETCDGRLVKL